MTKTLTGTARFAGSAEGYGRLTGFARRRDLRRWAVEGSRGAGRPPARRLVAGGGLVPGVPAKLAARVRVYFRGHGRKTDKHDAVSVGLAALDGSGTAPAGPGDVPAGLRPVRPARGAVRAADPGGVPAAPPARRAHPGRDAPGLTANKAQALPARIRPGDDVARIRLQPARGRLAGIRALDGRLKTAAAQISALVAATGTTLTSLFGVGPVTAGRILAEAGDVGRFAARDKFAGCNGTAPAGVSSGEQVCRRLSRAGNRRTGHALHTTASPRSAAPAPAGAAAASASAPGARPPNRRCAASNAGCRPGPPAADARRARQNRRVRITCDPAAGAACVCPAGGRLTRGRAGIPATPPEGVRAFTVPGREEDRLAGTGIPGAGSRPDLPGEAEILSWQRLPCPSCRGRPAPARTSRRRGRRGLRRPGPARRAVAAGGARQA